MHHLATVHARDNQRRHDTAYLNKCLFCEALKNCAVGMLKLITDRHEASHGLFATAELVVILSFCLVTLFASSCAVNLHLRSSLYRC